MKTLKELRNIKSGGYEKYASFTGKILVLGYGSVGQAVLPLLLRHLNLDPSNITVLEKDNNKKRFDERHKGTGIKYVRKEIDKNNYQKEFAKYVEAGGLIVNCSLNIDARSILEWCMENDVMQIDTSLERWEDDADEKIKNPAERTLFNTHNIIREAMAGTEGKATCCVTHGANPGYVTHLTKRGLLQLAEKKGKKVETPTTKEEWAQLMKSLGVKTVHIAERDTQVIDDPKVKGEFVNTWSCEGFWAEGRAPAEMGWGTHEDKDPEGGKSQGEGNRAAYLNAPGVSVLMKSWVPEGGQYNGFCVQHSESITLSQYFTTEKGDFRPSVYYVYQPCDAAITSVHEMRGHELDLQGELRIIKDEIISGIDELGILLIGDNFVFWHGSQMDIERARKLVPGESATSLQVAGSVLGAIVWMIKNPKMGYVEPEAIPFDQILEIGDMYWEPIVGVLSDWKPNSDVNSLFNRPYDKSNPCKFENFRVWT